MNKPSVIAAVVVVIGLAAASVLLLRDTKPQTEQAKATKSPQTSSWRCLPPVGSRFSWSVRIQSRYFIDPKPLVGRNTPPPPSKGERVLSSTLTMKVLSANEGGRNVELSLEKFAEPISIHINRQCAWQLPANFAKTPKDEEQWRLLLDLLAIERPEKPKAQSWQSRHEDGSGTYIASYKIDPTTPQTVQRKRQRYESVIAPGPANATAEIGTSNLTIKTAKTGGIQSWSGTEELTLKTAKGEVFATNETTITVRRTMRPSEL